MVMGLEVEFSELLSGELLDVEFGVSIARVGSRWAIG